jgi:hypothetical protein
LIHLQIIMTIAPRALPPTFLEQLAQIRAELQEFDIVLRGSITQRFMPCGTPGCRCQVDPPQLHGPYYQWTTKVHGKTQPLRLKPEEVEVFEHWIAQGQRLEQLVQQWRSESLKAAKIIREKLPR